MKMVKINTNPKCKDCLYNISKTKGGHGKICNGYTMQEFNRCPEWRISELRRQEAEAYLKKTTRT